MTTNFDRRNFLKLSAGASAALCMPSFTAAAGKAVDSLIGSPIPKYANWQDLYRKQWTWDKVVRGTHIVNCWYQAHCAWDVYVKDGLVFREEQAGEYEQVNPELPDYNPRGCQKGACYSQRMYDPTRVTHPLRRVGKRGGNQWERVSWDEALTDIADTWLDVAVTEGTDRMVWDMGPAMDLALTMASVYRLAALSQATVLDMNTEIGDGRRGTFETFGKISFESSADDYFYSDLILFWAGNPLYTQIPQAHFFTEAKWRGAKIISITPDYNASATKADLWVPIKPATDAALALGVCHLLIKHDKINHDFVREQTDMPVLVREDNGHFLSAADLKEGGQPNLFYFFDETSGSIQELPQKTLALGDKRPALHADTKITLKDGSSVRVATVFDKLVKRLADYTPEKVAETCGIKPGLVKRLATEIGNAKRMRNIAQSTYSKQYHGNLAERAQILVFALTGNIGRKGANYSGFPMLCPEGFEPFITAQTVKDLDEHPPLVAQYVQQRMMAGDTMEQIILDMGSAGFMPGAFPVRLPVMCAGTLFWEVHGGVSQLSDNAPDWNRELRRSVQDHLKEAVEKHWQPVYPKPGDDPRMLFTVMSNPFRRIRGSQKLDEVLLPKLKKYVVMDWRMSSSARYADYVLPVASWYETTNMKWVTPLSPYMTVTNQATKPMGQAKSDWEVYLLLAKKIQERARARGIGQIKSTQGLPVDFGNIYDEMSLGGNYTENDGEKLLKHAWEHGNPGLGSPFGNVTWEEGKKKGFARFIRTTTDPASISNMCDFPRNDSISALTDHTVKRRQYPTTTGRIQFYLDHPLYHEYDEALPRHKEPPTLGGDYPLTLTGGKTRWSIHAAWRDSPLMLRLHRNEPYVLISIPDAQQRDIREMDLVRVHNDVGSFQARAAVSPTMRPGQALMYHAWERHQFRGKGDMNSVSPSPINPVELAGGPGQHLQPRIIQGQPSMFDRETRIDIQLVKRAEELA